MKAEELRTMHLIFVGALLEKKIENKNYLNRTYIKEVINSPEKKDKDTLLK
jgi:hypothetical protein